MSRTIPYKLSLWKDNVAWYNTEVANPENLKINQIIYVTTPLYPSGIPYTTVYKGANEGTTPKTYRYEYRNGDEKFSGETTIENIKIGKQVFEETEVEELSSHDSTFEGRAYNINFTRNINGMNTLSFSIPKKYFDVKEGEMVTNHLPDLIWNKNKIKLYYDNQWFTFIVNNREESRENGKIVYNFECEDMFINELSRTGYNLIFDEEHGGIGTLDDLAPKILEGTDWEYIPTEDDEFIEKRDTYEENSDGSIKFDDDGFPIEKEETISTQVSEYNEVIGRAVYQYSYLDKNEIPAVGNKYYLKEESKIATLKSKEGDDSYTFQLSDNTEISQVKRDNIYSVFWDNDEDKKIWGYNTTETITSDVARNLIYNGKEYTDSTGWNSSQISGEIAETKIDTMSIVPEVTWVKSEEEETFGEITAASYTLKLTAIQNNAWAYNDTMRSARTILEEGSKYALRVVFSGVAPKVGISNGSSVSSQNNEPTFITGNYTLVSDAYYILKSKVTTSSAYLFFGLASKGQETSIKEVELFLIKPIGDENKSNNEEYIEGLGEGRLSSVDEFKKHVIMPGSSLDAYVEETVQLFYNLDDKNVKYVTLPEGAALGEIMIDNAKKVRTLKEEKSNRDNVLQTLAGLFEGWIRFEVDYLANGKIARDEQGKQKKRLKFVEIVGKNNWNGFHYGTNLTSITRTINSEEVVSKIWVENTESKNSESGIISIQDSSYNRLGEVFLYNFDYYVEIGEISKQQLLNDLYGTSSDNLGFITKMEAQNKLYKEANLKYSGLQTTINKLKAEREGTILRIQSAKENITTLSRQLNKEENVYKGTYYSVSVPQGDLVGSADQQKEARNSIIRWGTSIDDLYSYLKTLNAQLGYRDESNTIINDKIFETEAEAEEYELDTGYISQMKDYQKEMENITDFKKVLVTEFEEKYMRYITEGTWQDDNYTDADKYYFDAEKVLATSAMPTASYTINVLALKALNGYENYDFGIGDKTFVTDVDFFGYDKNGSPYKQEVVISEISEVLDSQNSSTITVQNFRTQFEDLFSRISATVQTVQLKDQIYSRSENFTANGEILVPILQNTLINNSLTLAQAVDQSVIVNDRGIEVTDIFNPNKKLRIVADGIYISSDGGLNWTSGFTASGMNANFIVSGQIDTNKLRIMNGSYPSFIWDKLGISAYQIYIDSEDSEDDPNNPSDLAPNGGLVRFDQHGFYIVPTGGDASKFGYDSNGVPWFASSILMEDYYKDNRITWYERLNYIEDNTVISLTWRGLNIKSSTGSVEIGTELPAIRIFDNNGGINDPENYCRVEIGFKDDGPGGITQRKDWNPGLKQGNENLYGITIRDKIGKTVLKTSENGDLWLKENLFIGGAGASELQSKIGIQANGRNVDLQNNTIIDTYIPLQANQALENEIYYKKESENTYIPYELIEIIRQLDEDGNLILDENNNPIVVGYKLKILNEIDPVEITEQNLDGFYYLSPKLIFWAKRGGSFTDQSLWEWYDAFSIDSEGKVTANSIEIIGDSQFHGHINATSGYFENIMGLGSISSDEIYDSGFSASPLNLFEYRKATTIDILSVGQIIYTFDESNDIYTPHELAQIDSENNRYYYLDDNQELKEILFSDIYLRVPIVENKDSNYAIWVKRLIFDEETGEAIGVKDHPEFSVSHDGQLFCSNAIQCCRQLF